MALVSIQGYAKEAGITQSQLRAHVKKFGLQPADKRNPSIYDRKALERVYPIWKQLDLFTPVSA